MKHVLVSIILLGSLTAFSQEKSKNPKMQKERIEQAKIAFLTTKLELTSDEAQEFWPIYNEMHKKIKENRSSMKKLYAPVKEGKGDLDDATYKSIIKGTHDSEEKSLELKKEYGDKMADVIGYKRVFELKMAEKEFKKRLMERMKKSNPRKKGDPGKPHRRNLIEKN